MTLGEKIIDLRKKRGLSQEELAITLGVSRQAVSKWELGDATPDTDKVVALANYFDVTTDWLLRDIAPPKQAADSTHAPISPVKAQTGAPILLCMTLGGSTCGLFLLFYGYFFAPTQIPAVIGIILQIGAIALAMAFGLYLKSYDAEQGTDFIRAFWRVDIWIVALLPMRFFYTMCLQLLNLIPQATLSHLWFNLPQPLWTLGRILLFAGIPIALYTAVCLFVTLVLWRSRKKK